MSHRLFMRTCATEQGKPEPATGGHRGPAVVVYCAPWQTVAVAHGRPLLDCRDCARLEVPGAELGDLQVHAQYASVFPFCRCGRRYGQATAPRQVSQGGRGHRLVSAAGLAPTPGFPGRPGDGGRMLAPIDHRCRNRSWWSAAGVRPTGAPYRAPPLAAPSPHRTGQSRAGQRRPGSWETRPRRPP